MGIKANQSDSQQDDKALASSNCYPQLDQQTLLELKPILDAGGEAIALRGQFQDLTVQIALALGVPCDSFKSEIVHGQYMELGQRILARIAENKRTRHPNSMNDTIETKTEPQVRCDDLFGTPVTVTALDCAFGGRMSKLLPPWGQIPDEYKRGHTKWNKVVSRWFFSGLPKETRFMPKPGIDTNTAQAHLRAILASFEPKHEHKEAGVAYLLSKWFEDVEVPNL